MGALSVNMLQIHQGIFYSKNHIWSYLEKSGNARIGLDDLLLHITGEVGVSHLKNPGEFISKGDLLAEIDQNGKSLYIFSPISGKILDSNPSLIRNHELLNEDPYGKGWIYNIKPSDWMAEVNSCFLAEEATNWLNKELSRYKDFLAMNIQKYSTMAPMVMLQDGGELAENSLSGLPIELWQKFQEEFLTP